MPTICHETQIDRPAAEVWDAVRDVGALHTRLVPGFVVATTMLPNEPVPVRRVTFATGTVLDEVIVTNDDARRRLVWTIRGLDHHNGAIEVQAVEDGARVTWTADVLPAALAERFAPLMAAGLTRMKAVLEQQPGD